MRRSVERRANPEINADNLQGPTPANSDAKSRMEEYASLEPQRERDPKGKRQRVELVVAGYSVTWNALKTLRDIR